MAKIERDKTQVKRREGSPPAPKPTTTEAPSIEGRLPGKVTSLKGVFFGPPKSGKTTVACSGANVLLIQFDPDGDSTETLIGRTDITVVVPESMVEVNQIIHSLYTTDAGRFDWVVIDSITFLFQLAGGKEVLASYIENKDMRRAYGRAGAMVGQVIHDLVNLKDTNVIFTAHLEKVGDEESTSLETELGESEVKLAVTPMVWKILGPAVSFIGRTHKSTGWEKSEGGVRNKVTSYEVSFNDGERSPAGSRLPMKGEYLVTGPMLQDLATELLGGN